VLSVEELKAFEQRVANLFDARQIRGPIHLSGGNEEALIQIFEENVRKGDWVFSTWRNHYHALLKGVPADELLHYLRTKLTMNVCLPEYKFFTSAIAGGILPIACGVAAGGNRVHCFVGDMTANMGIFHEVSEYAAGRDLDLHLYVEDNGFSTDSPTRAVCPAGTPDILTYTYSRTWPHMQKSPFGGPK